MKTQHLRPLGSPNLNRKTQVGQIIVEYVLLLVIVISIASLVRNYLLETQFIQNFSFKPWAKLDGMIQCGVWQPCGINNPARDLHPESGARAISARPL